jgi:predicted HicB family RNase H-like nuclease
MSINRIGDLLDEQEKDLQKQLSNGEMSIEEYNEKCRELERDARAEARSQYNDDEYSRWH